MGTKSERINNFFNLIINFLHNFICQINKEIENENLLSWKNKLQIRKEMSLNILFHYHNLLNTFFYKIITM